MRIGRARSPASARLRRPAVLLALAIALCPWGFGALDASDTTWDGSEPPQGIYFYWYEPSFYTGFAPRTQDPERVHIELARGNQVRVTVALGDRELDAYAGDLVERRAIYQEMIDKRVIVLTTNRQYERFTTRLDEVGAAGVAAAHDREQTIELMAKLNPERVFRIRMPLEEVAKRWQPILASLDAGASDGQKLDAANAVLPGRVNLTALSPELEPLLVGAAETARRGDDAALKDQA